MSSDTPAGKLRIEGKEYVVKERVAPVTIRERVAVGATIPAGVELRAVPDTWGPSVSRYRYVYHDDNVVLVDPSSRRVIDDGKRTHPTYASRVIGWTLKRTTCMVGSRQLAVSRNYPSDY